MLKLNFKKSSLLSLMDHTLISLPAPPNLSLLWNFGSLLSVVLISQIVTGLLLASSYSPSMLLSFTAMAQTMETSSYGWLLRYLHMNGATVYFLLIYAHMGRGIYFGSFMFKHTWLTGVSLFLASMATAFLGYVLPMNQMSFWGASVITNLFSEVPYIGPQLVQILWGGLSISDPTLMRFFTFHFMLPFVILALIAVHITMLHTTGSNNPLGLVSVSEKTMFHPYLSSKDTMGLFVVMVFSFIFILLFPLISGDNDNFTEANPMVTPTHIQPEWYFLFAYAILRSVPNKLGGVLALVASVLILYTLPSMSNLKLKGCSFSMTNKIMFWSLVVTVMILTWIGARTVEPPFTLIGQVFSIIYFSMFPIMMMVPQLSLPSSVKSNYIFMSSV